jgi:tRNA threonylcarbamoyladenosine biosynthesis protein TsaB
LLLAIETSTRAGSIALVDASGVIAERMLSSDTAATLAPAVAELVPDLSKIDAYAISVGPGSFTGLRIGIAFMKGLAVVHRVPAVPISSLEIIATQLAEAHPEHDLFLPMLDARKGEAFAALYRRDGDRVAIDPRLPEGVVRFDQLQPIAGAISAGDLIPPWAPSDPANATPRASVLGRIAQRNLPGRAGDALGVEPAYHQPSGAEINLGIRADGA